MSRTRNFWFDEPGFNPEAKAFILAHPFPDGSLYCQEESQRWAELLSEEGFEVEINEGFYYPHGDWTTAEGHTWLEVDGFIFDPTASLFDGFPELSFEWYEPLSTEYV